MSTPDDCPPEDDVACFLEGRAPSSLHERILGHLDHCHQCRILLAKIWASCEPAPGRPVPAPIPRTFRVGAVVGGRYKIDRFVARGGMGEVYAARDLELGDIIALKTIACTHLDHPRLASGIRAEVQLARRITHPNVCRILEFGVHQQRSWDHDESIPFFTMELLHGETLAAYVGRRGRLVESEALAIARQIVAGLAAIHAAGIVHRDLKPENVFIQLGTTCQGRVVVMDFGLARPTEVQSWSATRAAAGGTRARAATGKVRASAKRLWSRASSPSSTAR